ncbi:MAG: trypsin-like peptidase domain-containing protein [Clostridia bacterium]|jgi:S1-C subfamily serine protease|nr:trypsin-like peptidase domain-containing protein [Clostridia bacterium]MDD4408931.1 trypsin-like peptidase domain-containing protein [Clostridia bacterium]
MKKIVIFFIFVAIIFSSGIIISSCFGANIEERDLSVDMTPRLISTRDNMNATEVSDAVKSAVVGISASSVRGTSVGSGVAIALGGYILTNQHVVGSSNDITVYFADKTKGSAKLIWSDFGIDIAILKSAIDMPYLETAPLSEVRVGEDVLAIGTPLSLQFKHSVTKGIVSALNRALEVENSNGTISYMQNLIQHDASINSGNSGGPLINFDGKVIGINALKAADAEGIGFAIPIETATVAIEKVIPNNSFQQTYVGVMAYDAELAYFNDETDASMGAYVMDIALNSPAFNSQLQSGDVITRINLLKINNTLDLRKAIYILNVGDEIEIDVIRRGEIKTIRIAT